MSTIPAPSMATPDERFQGCLSAMEPALGAVIGGAEAAGWSRMEAILAATVLVLRFAAQVEQAEPTSLVG